MNKKRLTVIGLGPMGQAMANAYLDHGYAVTVWNRTASKADVLVKRGAHLAETSEAALLASELVILSLTDYQAMYAILRSSEKALNGRVIVNLSSDTPEQSRKAADWLTARGARFLVGGVMVPENLVGKEPSYVFYSGPEELFQSQETALRVIGRADYLGEDYALAQLFYQAQLDIFLTALAAYLHASALVGSAGVSAAKFLPYAVQNFDSLSSYLPTAAKEIDDARYPGDGANVIMMGATADHIVGASKAAGIDLRLPAAVKAYYDRAVALGRGRDGWTSLIEAIRSVEPMGERDERLRGASPLAESSRIHVG